MTTIDEYFENAQPVEKAEYDRLSKLVREVAPDAEETISYGMPTYKVGKNPLVYFGIFKDHMSIFPASGEVLSELGDELAGFKTAKGTLSFTADKPIPDDVLRDMLHVRLAEIQGSAS
jgi:uncharacterized protein YdhG (YjbR/CyaY superfamily)